MSNLQEDLHLGHNHIDLARLHQKFEDKWVEIHPFAVDELKLFDKMDREIKVIKMGKVKNGNP